MAFADSQAPAVGPRLFAFDGSPAGYRPGACYDAPPEAITADHAAVEAACAASDRALTEAWRMGAKPPALPQTREGAQAYYDARLATAYRGGAA